MRMALAEFTVDGVKTNADFLYLLMFHPEYLKGNVTTAFFEEHVAELLEWDHDSGIWKKKKKNILTAKDAQESTGYRRGEARI